MKISRQRSIGIIILVMTVLVVSGFLIARAYYGGENRSVDPRIREARELYRDYNTFATESELDSVFRLLDTIESFYQAIPHYAQSFEIGVIYNNRAAALLTLVQYRDTLPRLTLVENFGHLDRHTLLMIAEANLKTSIANYEQWLFDFDSLTDLQIQQQIQTIFIVGLDEYTEDERIKFLEKRVEELVDGQVEVPRRLSVAYTNLGIVNRMNGMYKEAALLYQRALDLWDANLTAENNLNRLLGRPLRKKSWLSRMFPKEKIDNR